MIILVISYKYNNQYQTSNLSNSSLQTNSIYKLHLHYAITIYKYMQNDVQKRHFTDL